LRRTMWPFSRSPVPVCRRTMRLMSPHEPLLVKRPWSNEETKQITVLRLQGKPVDEIARVLGRSVKAVNAKCSRLVKQGAIPNKKSPAWSAADMCVLENLSLNAHKVASLLSRSVAAVKTKRVKLGLFQREPNPWSPEQDEQLVQLRNEGRSFSEIASALKRTRSAISNRVHGLIKMGKIAALSNAERSRRGGLRSHDSRDDLWDDDERYEIKQLWEYGYSAYEISERMGRSQSAINNELGKMRTAGSLGYLADGERNKRAKKGIRRRSQEQYVAALNLVKSIPRTKTSGYVIGVLYGDGFITIIGDRGSIGLKSTNESFCRSFAEALEETFGKKTTFLSRLEQKNIGAYEYKDVRYYEAFLHSVYIAKAIRDVFGLTDEQSWRADLSLFVELGDRFIDGAIQGFFDAEGSFMKDGRRYYTTACSMNEAGLKSICELLRLRGYPATINCDKRGQWRTGIHRQQHVLRFATEIGSRIDYKAARMAECINQNSYNDASVQSA